MIEDYNFNVGTFKKHGQHDVRPSSSPIQMGNTFSLQNNQNLTKNLKELKQEITQLEKNMKTPFYKKSYQIHANMSHSKGIIHKFPINIAYGYSNKKQIDKPSQSYSNNIKECTTPIQRNNKIETIKQINREVDNELQNLLNAKENFVREKQLEIYEANEEFSKLLVEAQRIKRDENSLKLKRVDILHKRYQQELNLARQQFELQVSMLQQQLKDNIEEEEATTKTNIKIKITLLEKNSVFSKVDNVLYSKLTPTKINKLYNSISNSPYKSENDYSVSMKQNEQDSNVFTSKYQLRNNQTLNNSKKQNDNLKNQTYPLNSALLTSQSENKFKISNLDQTKTITGNHDNDNIYKENRYLSKSPSYAQSQADKLKRDIRQLQKSNNERSYLNSGSKSIQRSPHSSLSPAQRIYQVKAKKNTHKDDIYQSSSSEDEKKFLNDYKKHKENDVLKEKFKSNEIKDQTHNSKMKY